MGEAVDDQVGESRFMSHLHMITTTIRVFILSFSMYIMTIILIFDNKINKNTQMEKVEFLLNKLPVSARLLFHLNDRPMIDHSTPLIQRTF